MLGLAAAFFLTALIYAAAGFGGGSTYNALLVLADTNYRAIPIVSLCCNIVVVTVGSWRFTRDGHIDWRRIWPLFTLSVPLAWLGGRLVVAELVFVGLLAVSLLVAGLLMLWQPRWQRETPAPPWGRWLEPVAGGTLGFLAGVVGIGGGIFLAPLLYMLRWGNERAIAGTSAVFILVNSIAGLAGQLSKGDGSRSRRARRPLAALPRRSDRRSDRVHVRQQAARSEACPHRHCDTGAVRGGPTVSALV